MRVDDSQEAFNGLGLLSLSKGEQDGRTCYSPHGGERQELAVDGPHPPGMEPDVLESPPSEGILVRPAAI